MKFEWGCDTIYNIIQGERLKKQDRGKKFNKIVNTCLCPSVRDKHLRNQHPDIKSSFTWQALLLPSQFISGAEVDCWMASKPRTEGLIFIFELLMLNLNQSFNFFNFSSEKKGGKKKNGKFNFWEIQEWKSAENSWQNVPDHRKEWIL